MFSSSGVAKNYCRWKIGKLESVFGVLLLDRGHTLIRFEGFSRKDGLTSLSLQKKVVQAVLAANASAVIFTQNYPAGPGDDTLQSLQASLAVVGVPVLDQIVVREGEVISLRQRRLLLQPDKVRKMIEKHPDYRIEGDLDPLESLKGLPCCSPFSHPDYRAPTPEQVDTLIRGMGWSQADAAKIVGVACDAKKGSTTLRKWRSPAGSPEYRAIPYAAWRLLLINAGLVTEEEDKA